MSNSRENQLSKYFSSISSCSATTPTLFQSPRQPLNPTLLKTVPFTENLFLSILLASLTLKSFFPPPPPLFAAFVSPSASYHVSAFFATSIPGPEPARKGFTRNFRSHDVTLLPPLDDKSPNSTPPPTRQASYFYFLVISTLISHPQHSSSPTYTQFFIAIFHSPRYSRPPNCNFQSLTCCRSLVNALLKDLVSSVV